MNIIKIQGKYINFDNVAKVEFETREVYKLNNNDWWSTDYSTMDGRPMYEETITRQALVAYVYFLTEEQPHAIIDAEPLRDYLNKAAMDLDVDAGE